MTIMDRAAASFSQEAVSVNAEIPYTSIIRNEIDRMDSVEDLISYLTDNRYIFAVSKVTSTEQVRALWNDISSPGGLADQELENHFLIIWMTVLPDRKRAGSGPPGKSTSKSWDYPVKKYLPSRKTDPSKAF